MFLAKLVLFGQAHHFISCKAKNHFAGICGQWRVFAFVRCLAPRGIDLNLFVPAGIFGNSIRFWLARLPGTEFTQNPSHSIDCPKAVCQNAFSVSQFGAIFAPSPPVFTRAFHLTASPCQWPATLLATQRRAKRVNFCHSPMPRHPHKKQGEEKASGKPRHDAICGTPRRREEAEPKALPSSQAAPFCSVIIPSVRLATALADERRDEEEAAAKPVCWISRQPLQGLQSMATPES